MSSARTRSRREKGGKKPGGNLGKGVKNLLLKAEFPIFFHRKMSVPSQNEEGALHRRERVGTLTRELFPPLEKYYERNRESVRGRQFTWANTLPSGIAAPRIDRSQWTLETFLPSIFPRCSVFFSPRGDFQIGGGFADLFPLESSLFTTFFFGRNSEIIAVPGFPIFVNE